MNRVLAGSVLVTFVLSGLAEAEARVGAMGEKGMHEMAEMNMRGPKNTLPMMAAKGIVSESVSSASARKKSGEVLQYTCPMHHDVVQDHPGDCLKCGTELVPKTR